MWRGSQAEFSLFFRNGLGGTMLANVVDNSFDSRILGTVAGANTLVVCRGSGGCSEIEEQHRK